MIGKYAIEHWCKIPCEVELASEFRYREPILTRSTLVIAWPSAKPTRTEPSRAAPGGAVRIGE